MLLGNPSSENEPRRMPENIIENTVSKQILANMIHEKQEKNFQNENKLFYYYLLLDLSEKKQRKWTSLDE